MFVSPDQKRIFVFRLQYTNCVKDKRNLKILCIFFFFFIKPTIFFNVFSDFNKMAEKRKFSDGKTFGRPKFRTEKFSDKKKSESFSVRKFSFLIYTTKFMSIVQRLQLTQDVELPTIMARNCLV